MVSQVEGCGVLLKQVMLAKALQPENAAFSIEPMPSGKSMLARAEHTSYSICICCRSLSGGLANGKAVLQEVDV